mgnify:CR=1 FL=1|tara:strand:+ start:96 stop:758 length:663 start_codon:yes stop_codon:yes gene_type:complete
MHNVVDKIISIKKEIQEKIIEEKLGNYKPTIVAISKTFSIDKILPLIDYGHDHFGENKVQEALEKWTQVKETNQKIKLHMVGKLQTNKVKNALKIFDYIHSLDSIKLAEKIANEQKKLSTKPKLFIQINIGKEFQKSGIDSEKLVDFYQSCKNMGLEIIGTMCLPPENKDSNIFFSEMKNLNKKLNLIELSMGMSNDYLNAIKYSATYLRIGSKIFGSRN